MEGVSTLGELARDLGAAARQIPHSAADVVHAAVLSVEQASPPGAALDVQSTFTGDGSALLTGARANIADLGNQLSDGLAGAAVSLLKGHGQ